VAGTARLGSEWSGAFRLGKARSGMAGMVSQDRSSQVVLGLGMAGKVGQGMLEVGSVLFRLARYVALWKVSVRRGRQVMLS
jgi:hypothetical protein